jgi:hypothetical protein
MRTETMTDKEKRSDQDKTRRNQASQGGRNRSGQQRQETDRNRQQSGWSDGQAMRKHRNRRGGQQEAKGNPVRRQGGWSQDEGAMNRQGGRLPPAERDRDYDPDGDRLERQ